MGERRGLLVVVVVVVVVVMCYAMALVGGYEYEEGESERREREEGRRRESEELFKLQDMKRVVKTDAGEMKVVKGFNFGEQIFIEKPMHIGFITMEPKALFIPQYLDSDLILFVHRGEAKVGSIYKDDPVERRLKAGDVYRIAGGSAFYIVNTGEGQRLHIICSIDKSQSLGWGTFQAFFIGGGTYPKSILAGFDPLTLSSAFNVSTSELREIMTRQQSGPIVYLSDLHPPSIWKEFLQLEKHERLQHLKRMVHFQEAATKEEEEPTWSFRKLLNSVFGKEKTSKKDKWRTKALDSYNLYERRPDFKNNYGWSIALDKSDYWPLGHSNIGLFLVNLTAGSMMAPHINPTATEYGIVLRGSGTIQVVFPNGTSAMNAKVQEGDVFLVPRYFAFCQIASRTGPFEFFGFTTSSRKNRPQFLAGTYSILQSMKGPEFAASLGISENEFQKFIDAQREGVILPSASAAPPDKAIREEEEKMMKNERIPKMFRNLGNEMVMGFD